MNQPQHVFLGVVCTMKRALYCKFTLKKNATWKSGASDGRRDASDGHTNVPDGGTDSVG